MGAFKSAMTLLVLSGTTLSCTQADAPGGIAKMSKPELEQVNPADFSYAKVQEEAENVLKNPSRCSDCKPLSGTFAVSYEMHHGYSLAAESGQPDSIVPILLDKDVKGAFDQFFAQENLAGIVGKRIYCECVGDSLERDGGIFYSIRKARLFAR